MTAKRETASTTAAWEGPGPRAWSRSRRQVEPAFLHQGSTPRVRRLRSCGAALTLAACATPFDYAMVAYLSEVEVLRPEKF